MKNLIITLFFIFLVNCSGYKPIFSSEDTNFNINEINIIGNNKISQKLKMKMTPYLNRDNKKLELNLDIDSSRNIKTIARNEKGDASIFEMEIIVKIKISSKIFDDKSLKFSEKFSFNNQSNKFELEQYKSNIESDLINKIFENLILKLRAL